MELFNAWKMPSGSTQGPGPSSQGPALTSPAACVGREIVYEGESPLRADLAFVHGLGGHRYNTWSKNGVFWPKDLLSKDVQSVRIITFGYDSHIVRFFGQASRNQIHDHAHTLIADLWRYRGKGEENTHPIIFIAHSLGGLVVKDALEFAGQTAEDQPRDGMIFLSTYGIVFLGTPHRDSHLAGLGILAANFCRAMLQDANSSILRSLEQVSNILERVRGAFERMMAHEEVEASSFVEEIPTAGVGMVVEKYSGQIGNVLEGKGYIHATHQDMSKFDSGLETGYQRVADVIEDFVGREYGESFTSRRDYQPRIALWGLGGVGKTQIAIEFCFQGKPQGRDVFWVHGSSDETLGASFREIAQSVHLVSSGDDQDTLLKAVKSWFETSASGNWTIVIDNLDDIELQSRLYIPVRHGEILFTTRDERILGHPSLVPAGAGIGVLRVSEKDSLDPDNLPSALIEAALWPKKGNYFKQLAPLQNFGLLANLRSKSLERITLRPP